jgi:hypothetical protein
MRPVSKPRLPDFVFGLSAEVLLFHALGEYCSLCERPLPAESWCWHKRLGTEGDVARVEGANSETIVPSEPRRMDRSDWHNVLMLDWNCYLAQRDRKADVPLSLLLPDESSVCFRVDRDSPLTYRLEAVTLIITGPEGQVLDKRERESVIVEGHTEAARETINYFALNTRYFDAARREFRIPEADALSLADRRVNQRTRVWHMATRLAETLAEFRSREGPEIDLLIENARLAIAAAGFWSTWATVFWRKLNPDRPLLRRLLLPRDQDWTVGPGPHNLFPGTREDWLQ